MKQSETTEKVESDTQRIDENKSALEELSSDISQLQESHALHHAESKEQLRQIQAEVDTLRRAQEQQQTQDRVGFSPPQLVIKQAAVVNVYNRHPLQQYTQHFEGRQSDPKSSGCSEFG